MDDSGTEGPSKVAPYEANALSCAVRPVHRASLAYTRRAMIELLLAIYRTNAARTLSDHQ